MLKRFALVLALVLCAGWAHAAPLETAIPMELTSPSAMLVEAETGTVIFEKGADEKRSDKAQSDIRYSEGQEGRSRG